MGHTLTLDLPDEIYESLVRRAKETSQSPDAVAAQLLASVIQPAAEDPLERFIGAFDSHGLDWTDRHDSHFGKEILEASRLSGLCGFLRGIDTEIEREPDRL